MSDNSPQEKVKREFKITSIALKNKNTVYILALLLIGFGLYSYNNLPKELFPEIVWPQIVVNTVYNGNSPIDIENLITRPIEKEVESARGVKEITSISAQDASMIFVEFNTNVDLEIAKQRVKDAVDNAENDIPQNDADLFGPYVFDIDFSEFPIITINLSGDFSVEELKGYAEYLEDEIEEIPEISKVLIEGVNKREVKINVDLAKLEALELSFFDIQMAVMEENLSTSAGEIKLGNIRRSIRIDGEIENAKELENIVIKQNQGDVVYLKDVAEVIDGYAEPSSYARLDNHPVVSVQVVKKGGENLLEATKKIFKVVEKAKEDQILPTGLNIQFTNDQSEMVEMQLANLQNSMFMGVILVILVLFFFLGTRNALFVGLAIPMSIFISFVIIGIIDFRINMIVLFALILALGMLVDNAIVAVENIYRFIEKGYKPWEAAKLAVSEIAVPIIASTLTTLAAFFPLALWEGIMGEFMKYLPITLIIVLSSSLFVALVIIPVVSGTFVKHKKENEPVFKHKKTGYYIAFGMIVFGLLFLAGSVMVVGNLLIIFGIIGLTNLTFLYKAQKWFQEVFLTRLENFYLKVIHWALKGWKPFWLLLATFLVLILTTMFYFGGNPKVNLFPNNQPNYINVITELPAGTDITYTNEFTKKLEKDVSDFFAPYIKDTIVESILATVGKGNPEDFTAGNLPNKSLITINFVDYEFRKGVSTSKLMRELSELLLNKYSGVDMEIVKDNMGPPTGKQINIEVIGREFDELIAWSDSIKTIVNQAQIDGIEGLKLNISTNQPEIIVKIDKEKARKLQLSTQQIGWTLRNALYGFEVSEYKVGEDEFPIMLRAKDNYRYSLAELENIVITFFDEGKPIQIPISSVANFEYSTTYSSIRRKDLDRVLTLYSNVIEGYNATLVNQRIKLVLKDLKLPPGYKYEFTGEQKEQKESSEFLGRAFMIALALILIILVTQFNSIIRPIIILMSILFSTIGVFGGLATFQMEFIVIMTGIGIISLAGIVVNNAIVLIDYIDLLKKRKRAELGMPENAFLPVDIAKECIIQGGKTRLRPVLLTAITTILGLLPMAIGLNIDFAGFLSEYKANLYVGGDMVVFWGPMAWTVIFGLTFSTFLTLVIVPVMYRLTTIAQHRITDFIEIFKAKNGLNGTKKE